MEKTIIKYIKEALSSLYSADTTSVNIPIEVTREGIEGDFTIVVYSFTKYSKKKPEDTAKDLGVFIKSKFEDIASYNIIKGFLNIRMTPEYWINNLNHLNSEKKVSNTNRDLQQKLVIEFSSPNTNKPLHLGHIRNNLLGDSVSRICQASGMHVIKVNLINDRGIHICKSMLAWIKWGDNKTPADAGLKGDKFVGDFYVLFENKYKNQIAELINAGKTEEEAKAKAPIIIEARELLKRWEQNDAEVLRVWKMMNEWVYEGFEDTYTALGIGFDKTYYESQTYLLGKEIVMKGLDEGLFYRETDSSVWIDLTNQGMDKKILLRSDGTTVYITQDIGTAMQRFEDFNPDKIIYVVGNEQDYHFKVLKNIIACFDKSRADRIEHLSYGMVELPEGKMKSREGIVVDADDLISEMIDTALKLSNEAGKTAELNEDEKSRIIKIIALGALKYYILKVDPKKQIVFNPNESIDFNGNTGPFIQYTHARICSILRNAEKMKIKFNGKISAETNMVDQEIELISYLTRYPYILTEAAQRFDPGVIANYVYTLVKEYNQYYHEYSILKETDPKVMQLRLMLSKSVAKTIKDCMNLLGIEVPEIM